MRTGDHALLKELNQSIALNVLRREGPLSRTQLSKRTGLNKATITAIVEDFIKTGLASELGHAKATVGRRPVLVNFNVRAGFAIGIEIEHGVLHGVVTDLSGTTVEAHSQHVSQGPSLTHTIDAIHTLLQRFVAAVPESPLGILGFGFGAPGLVDYEAGTILNAPNLGWMNVPLRTLIQSEWDYPVFVDNEANAGALGETLFGAGHDLSSLVYISAGAGIGAGIVMANELVRGARGLAGEFGHMVINFDGPACACGSNGCLEIYASETRLLKDFERRTGGETEANALYQHIQASHPAALESVRTIGHALGIGIANIANALNPSAIIIGNRLAKAGPVLVESVLDELGRRCFTIPHSDIKVTLGSMGQNGCAIGAASLVLHEYFSVPKTV